MLEKLKSWTTRKVYSNWKEVFKVPDISHPLFKQTKSIFMRYLKNKNVSFQEMLQYISIILNDNYRKKFGWIHANLRDKRAYLDFPEIVMETKISILWLLNIQELWTEISREESDKIWHLLMKYSKDHNRFIKEGHTLHEWTNWARDKDWKIKLFDAGSDTMHDTLSQEYEAISRALSEVQEKAREIL